MTSASEVKKEERKPPPKKPARKMKIPSVQPESMAVKNPFQARSFLPAPMFCATKADRLCMTEEGISMMKDTIFCATPYPAEGMSPMLLTMELMTRKEICTMVS